MRHGAKGHMLATSEHAGRALDSLSKSALIDAYLSALARANGSADSAPTIAEALADLRPILSVRGDRIPKSLRS